MRILIIGGDGLLGRALQGALAHHDVSAPPHARLEITDGPGLRAHLLATEPEVVINCAALHDLPRCERDPVAAYRVNAAGPRHLARACRELGARLVQVSTDYVFAGDKGAPYREEDEARPVNVYGATKLMGEREARGHHRDTLVVRTAGLFGHDPCRGKPGGRTFPATMLALAREGRRVEVVADQRSSPTYAPDLAAQIATLLEAGAPAGVYHAANTPGCSWYELAATLFELAGLEVDLRPRAAGARTTGAVRPADSRLANTALRDSGLLTLRPLRYALADYLERRAEIDAARTLPVDLLAPHALA